MSGYSIEIKGLDKLSAALMKKANLTEVRNVVKSNTAQLQAKAMAQTSVAYTGHYEGKRFVKPTGATKRGIGLNIEDNGFTGIVGMSMDYNSYLENGTRFMRARPVLKPTFLTQQVQFINQLKQLVR